MMSRMIGASSIVNNVPQGGNIQFFSWTILRHLWYICLKKHTE